jgi:tetratricopeptide (TPR) repeat protein
MNRRILACLVALAGTVGCGAHEGNGAANSPASVADPVGGRSAKWFFDRGSDAVTAGDSVRAEQYLSAALDKGYPRERVIPLLLRACVSSFRLRAALGYAEPELRRHPDDAGLRYLVATLLLGLGETDAARANLDELLQKNDEYAEAHYLVGTLDADRFGERAVAEEHFRRYLALLPNGDHAAELRGRLDDLGASKPSRIGARDVAPPRRIR